MGKWLEWVNYLRPFCTYFRFVSIEGNGEARLSFTAYWEERRKRSSAFISTTCEFFVETAQVSDEIRRDRLFTTHSFEFRVSRESKAEN
jgi:hypothetical protein